MLCHRVGSALFPQPSLRVGGALFPPPSLTGWEVFSFPRPLSQGGRRSFPPLSQVGRRSQRGSHSTLLSHRVGGNRPTSLS
ncbi:hypothetical protein CHS0354_026182, partial [Potamilus streckersoni]